MTTTFVTFYIDLELTDSRLKQAEYRFACFQKLASTGIPICVFTSVKHEERIKVLSQTYSNIHFMGVLSLDDLSYKKYTDSYSLSLPSGRNTVKDTYEYMILQNSKLDCIMRAIETNPFQTSQFAWIDFSIYHIIKNEDKFSKMLRKINSHLLRQTDKVYIPGCKDKIKHPCQILELPNWRFCGGFFIGTIGAIQAMNECIIENIDSFFQTYKQSTWEVNLWAYCEAFCGLDVAWYKADHNETILQIPSTEFRVESYADIYCLSVDGSDRDVRMKQRFSALSLSVQFIQAILEERGCMRGHLRMIRTFYETSKKEFGVFLEDDIYLRKNFKTYIDTFCQHMIEKDLDILLIGYLMTFSPRNSYHFPTILQSEHYTFHSYPDDTWGTQGYILSKAHAAYILEKVNELYIERIPIYHLPDYNPDWIITKRGKRALVYPMLAVEEGVVRHDHPGQVAFHRQSKEFNYDPEKYI